MKRVIKIKRLKNSIILLLCIFCLFMFCTIAYSAFSTTMNITGVAYSKLETDVRITDFFISDTTNGSISMYETFSKNSIFSDIKLSENSSITYSIEITNYGNRSVGIFDITGIPENLYYTFEDYNLKDMICDSDGKCNNFVTKTYKLKIYTTDYSFNGSLNLYVDFRKFYNISYAGFSGDYVDNIIEGDNIEIDFSLEKPPYVFITNLSEEQYNYSNYILNLYNVDSDITIENVVEASEEFDYTGDVQTFVAPYSGLYKLEVWGAQGGSYNSTYYGGYGGYSTGNVYLERNQAIYVVVGGQGTGNCVDKVCLGGYNGGGNSGISTWDVQNYTSSGGGATHIALINEGVLSNYKDNISDLLLVAGGGGGGYYHISGDSVSSVGGAGGGLNGLGEIDKYSPSSGELFSHATGGTQTSGGIAGYRGSNGSFGQGGSGASCNSGACGSSGGGGGFYGGGAAGHGQTGGGSGYIGNLLNGITLDGDQSIPSHNGISNIVGNSGHGYAKISLLELDANDKNKIFISDVNYTNGNNVDANLSMIDNIDNTSFISNITLSEDINSSISYDITITNNSNYDYYFNGVNYNVCDNLNNTDNIKFGFEGLMDGDIIQRNTSKTFKIIFYYNEIESVTNNIFCAKIVFDMLKIYTVSYIGIDNTDYPDYAIDGKPLEIDFSSSIGNLKIKSGNNIMNNSMYSFDGSKLIISKIFSDVVIADIDNIQLVPDFSFSNGEFPITMGGHNVYRVNAISINVNLTLNGTYDISNMKYLEFELYIPEGYNPTSISDVESQFEIGSAGIWDREEISYVLNYDFYNKLKSGTWNYIRLSLDSFNQSPGGCNFKKINYMGLYWNNEATINEYVIPDCLIRNLRFTSAVF